MVGISFNLSRPVFGSGSGTRPNLSEKLIHPFIRHYVQYVHESFNSTSNIGVRMASLASCKVVPSSTRPSVVYIPQHLLLPRPLNWIVHCFWSSGRWACRISRPEKFTPSFRYHRHLKSRPPPSCPISSDGLRHRRIRNKPGIAV